MRKKKLYIGRNAQSGNRRVEQLGNVYHLRTLIRQCLTDINSGAPHLDEVDPEHLNYVRDQLERTLHSTNSHQSLTKVLHLYRNTVVSVDRYSSIHLDLVAAMEMMEAERTKVVAEAFLNTWIKAMDRIT